MLNQKPEVRDAIAKKKDLSDELIEQIESSIAEFQPQYASGVTAAAKQEKESREPVAV